MECFNCLELYLPTSRYAFFGVKLWLSRGKMAKFYGYGELLIN